MTNLKQFLAVFLLAVTLQACSVSTEDLEKEVRASIEERLAGEEVTIKDFTLLKKEGNQYQGMLETKEEYGEFTYTVDVLYDGETFTWEIVR